MDCSAKYAQQYDRLVVLLLFEPCADFLWDKAMSLTHLDKKNSKHTCSWQSCNDVGLLQ